MSPGWAQAAVLVVAVVLGVVVAVVPVPAWVTLIGAALVGWLVASFVYAKTSILIGRMIGLSVVALVVMLAFASGWWWFALVPPVLGILVPTSLWVSGERKPDAIADDRTTVPQYYDDGNRLVDALDGMWGSTRAGGPRCGLRAAHSHGSMAEGTWRSAGDGGETGVALFAPGREGRAVARFSNFSGEVTRDDRRRAPHGFAVRLEADGAGYVDLVLVDIARFPTATREDFVTLTRIFRLGRLRQVVDIGRMVFSGRSSLRAVFGFFRASRATSYVTRTYHGLNSFYWSRKQGREPDLPVRYLARPVASPFRPRPTTQPRPTGLDEDLRERLAAGQVEFDVELVLGQDRDGTPFSEARINDALHTWPQRNRRKLCRITLDTYCPDAERTSSFDPLNLPEGIRPSDDEILLARGAAYPASFRRRVVEMQVT